MGLFNDDSTEMLNELKKSQGLWEGVETPNLVWKDYNPEAFNPDTADYQLINEDPRVQSDQMSALAQLAGLSQNGLSDVDEAGYQRARSEAGQMQSQNLGAALANAQDRGLSGSGMEFAMREMAGQNAANQAQNADLQQAADSAKQRALYAQAYGQGLSNLRGQNYQTSSANSNIVNQFNQANTQAKNAADYSNIQGRNQAQQMNNEGRTNTQQQNFNNQITKIGGQVQANTGLAQGSAAVNAANQGQTNAIIGAGATMAGAYFGGPAGAMAANQAVNSNSTQKKGENSAF